MFTDIKNFTKKKLLPLLKMLPFGTKKVTTGRANNLGDTTIEDYETVIRQAACDKSFLQSYFEEDPFSEHPEYLYDLEEYDLGYCQKFFDEEISNCTIPVYYARTEMGTFFWAATKSYSDEDLIEPIQCSTYNQLAIPQNV